MRTISKINRVFLIFAGLLLILMAIACNLSASQPTLEPIDSSQEEEESPTEAVEPTSESTGQDGLSLTLDVGGVAQGFTSEVVPAVTSTQDGPWWENMPEHIVITLDGYPVEDHLMAPQIFIYPVQGLRENEHTGNMVTGLEALLDSQKSDQNLPYLPLYNAGQMLHAQVKFFDFSGGSGVRYLTQFAQALVPINNNELLYTFQGLTGDGKYYVSAVLPVRLFGLPANAMVDDSLPDEFFDNYELYINETVQMLNQKDEDAYQLDLSKLDAMIASIEVH